jgi:hypothetical protein
MSAGGKKSSKINGIGASGDGQAVNPNADDEVVVDD